MRISSTEKYISLALHTLESSIVPELQSTDAKAGADMVKMVLGEILKREDFTPRVLEQNLADGNALVQELEAFHRQIDGKQTGTTPLATGHAETSFRSLIEQHSLLTERIAHLADSLVAHRSRIADPKQQQALSALMHKVAVWDYAYWKAQRETPVPTFAAPEKGPGGPLTRERLEAFLRTQHPDGERCSVVEMNPIPGGFAKQTFRVTVKDASGKLEPLIVRKCDPTPMGRMGCFLLDQEFYLIKDAFKNSDLPLAEPLYLAKDFPGVDATFYAMSPLPGTVPSTFLGGATADIPETVILQMAEFMARLHSLKLDTYPNYLERFGHPDLYTDTVESCYRRTIKEWKQYFETSGHLPSPFVSYLFDWLEQNVPKHTSPPVLIHGDFNVHNILVENERITGVLDWECAMFGAPEQDLAYLKQIISHHIEWDRFLAHYRASGGPEIDEASMDFYMTFASMRMCVIFNRGVVNLQSGVTRDIRYAVVEMELTPEFMRQSLMCTTGTA
ncbi:phosphotransferase family protein [Telluria mixta]|uniref:Phosphotransferase family protein n=1 Tax=Telluria mixta TaxID=34071 RepID=A0ABT2C206_9BURK|nr:phosphotransferase family protein [Telluria mixta]MCS0631217.1 phosphotransferase family protein [Telluria mixta]WEM95756.1 phosphotransferase family protein [Telluria mixta]